MTKYKVLKTTIYKIEQRGEDFHNRQEAMDRARREEERGDGVVSVYKNKKKIL